MCYKYNFLTVFYLHHQVNVFPLGDSNMETTINYTMALGATGPESPETGSLGGPSISLWGKSCLDIEPCVKNCSQTPTY